MRKLIISIIFCLCLCIILSACGDTRENEPKKTEYDIEKEQIEANLNKFIEKSNAAYLEQYSYIYTIDAQRLVKGRNLVISKGINDIYENGNKIWAVINMNQFRFEIDCTSLFSELKAIVDSEDYYDNYAYLIEIISFDPRNIVLESVGDVYSEDDYYIYSDLGQLVIVNGKMLEIEKLVN